MAKKKIIIIISAVAAFLIAALTLILVLGGKPEEEAPEILSTEPVTEVLAETVQETVPETEPPELTDRAKELLAINPDTVGWITVEQTKVDNPITQGTDNDYYLNHDFEGNDFRAGTVFLDYRDRFGYNEEEQSENIILYGHNMANNTMFGSLRRYRQDMSFYKQAPFIILESNYKVYDYVIFALVITDGSASASWRYWDMEDLPKRAQFRAYVQTAKEKSMVDIPVDVTYGDKLLTLSTCYSDKDNSRFLVIARRLREDETRDSFSSVFAEEN